MDFGIRRTTANTTEVYALQAEGIRGAEDSPNIVLAANIIKHYNKWHFLYFVESLRGEAIHLLYGCFLHILYLLVA